MFWWSYWIKAGCSEMNRKPHNVIRMDFAILQGLSLLAEVDLDLRIGFPGRLGIIRGNIDSMCGNQMQT
jgi:hypothetical protein